jgi:hypothetical protein
MLKIADLKVKRNRTKVHFFQPKAISDTQPTIHR